MWHWGDAVGGDGWMGWGWTWRSLPTCELLAHLSVQWGVEELVQQGWDLWGNGMGAAWLEPFGAMMGLVVLVEEKRWP